MFEKSIIAGLSILGNWQIWIVAGSYLMINFIFLIFVAKIARNDETDGEMGRGCLLHIIGGTVLEGMLMGIMIALIIPILLGGTSTTPFFLIVRSLWTITKISAVAVAVVTILGFVPLFGKLLRDSAGIEAFLEGAIIFRLLAMQNIDKILTEANVEGSVTPGFWSSVGFFMIAVVLVRLIMFLLSLLTKSLRNTVAGELMPIVIIPVFGVIGGIIPFLMYASYFHLSLMQLLK